MKSLKNLFLENIMNSDELHNSIDDSAYLNSAKTAFRAYDWYGDEKFSREFKLKRRGDTLFITSQGEFDHAGIFSDKLHEQGIKKIKIDFIKGSYADLIHCDLSSLKIVCDKPICVGYEHHLGPDICRLSDVELEAPKIDLGLQRSNLHVVNNVKIKTTLFDFTIRLMTPGMKMLNKIGFGKFAMNRFDPCPGDECNYNSAEIANTVTVKDILSDAITDIQAKYIIVEPMKARVNDGCYIIINPNHKADFERMRLTQYPIETLKDGWFITQYWGDMRTLRQNLSK